MSESLPLSVLLAEKLRRDEERVSSTNHYQARFTELAAQCRAEFHPKQRAAFASLWARLAIFCTRRAGKTRGGCREVVARCLEQPNQRWVYCHETKDEARKIAWRSDRGDGFRDIVEQLGLSVARSIVEFNRNRFLDVLISEDDMSIDFRNGSQIIIFAADKDDAADKFRGGEKNGIWVDEAQGFGPLTYFLNDVAAKALAKPKGKPPGVFWVSGSPHRSLSGEFYEITRDPVKHGPRRKGWEVHEFSVVDNPYFGATPAERWDATAGEELRINGWDPKDPPAQFIREWGTPEGKVTWTTEDTLHVFCIHQKPPHEWLAPVCVDEFGFYDHNTALLHLPPSIVYPDGSVEPIEHWYFSGAFDFGYEDPFGYVIWGWSPQIADIFEMASWKKRHLPADDIEAIVKGVWDNTGTNLVGLRGDSGGAMTKGSMVGWEDKLKVPIEAADKHGKDSWTDLFNGELWARRVHFRQNSALLNEVRELQYKVSPTGKREIWKRRIANGIMHGDTLVDAGCRYAYRDLVGRRTEFGVPTPKSQADLDREQERRLLNSLDAGPQTYDNNED